MLGDGAIALHRVAYALDAVRIRLEAFGDRFFETEQRARPYEDLRFLTQEMDELTERFAGELGRDHQLVTAFAEARTATGDIIESLELLKNPGAPGASDIWISPEAGMDHVEQQRTGFDEARERFMVVVRRSKDDAARQGG